MISWISHQVSRAFRWFVGHRRAAHPPKTPVASRVRTAASAARMHSYGYARIYNRRSW